MSVVQHSLGHSPATALLRAAALAGASRCQPATACSPHVTAVLSECRVADASACHISLVCLPVAWVVGVARVAVWVLRLGAGWCGCAAPGLGTHSAADGAGVGCADHLALSLQAHNEQTECMSRPYA